MIYKEWTSICGTGYYSINNNNMGSIYVVSLLFVGLSMLVSARLRSKFSQYNGIPLSSGSDRAGDCRKNAPGKRDI